MQDAFSMTKGEKQSTEKVGDVLARASAAILAGEVLLALVSWVVSALVPGAGLRSLLDGEGVRWLFRNSTSSLLSPLLVWLLMGSMAWGCMKGSGVMRMRTGVYRERAAFGAMLLCVAVYVGAIILLALVPHAVLLSATGSLFPSPFSAALVPVVLMGISVASLVFGAVAGRYESISHCFRTIAAGIGSGAPFIIFYMLAAHCWSCIKYVFYIC